MFSRKSSRWIQRGFAALALGGLVANAAPSQPAHASTWKTHFNFASPRFQKVWHDADAAVIEGKANRSWTWGATPWYDYKEFYKQSPNSLRLVQYFDKARMEINDPANTSGALGGVTNGLLPVEMVSGRMKLGDGTGPDQNDQREPALVPVAGDPVFDNPDGPTYASFRSVATTDNGYKDANKVGQRVGATLNIAGSIGFRQDLADKPGTDIVTYESVTGHNVPRVFNDFRNGGPVPAIVAFGLPITDPYWVTTKVGGQNKDVLVQIYERRVITYTPSNPAQYQVEMGNVGQHYFQWRYPHLGAAWNPENSIRSRVIFASRQDGPEFKTVIVSRPDGTTDTIFGDGKTEAVPFSGIQSYKGGAYLFGDSRPQGGKRQLWAANYLSGRIQSLYTGSTTSNDYNAAVSPDGTKVAFVSDRDGGAELYLLSLMTGRVALLTLTNACTNQYPSWLPDGSAIVFESDCIDGNFEIYRMPLTYIEDRQEKLELRLYGPFELPRLTNSTSNERYPRVSPDGRLVTFTSNRDGNDEIYLMNIDGGQQRRLTDNKAQDQASAWTLGGEAVAFASNRDGDWEIYQLVIDTGEFAQLTNNSHEDNWPVFSQ